MSIRKGETLVEARQDLEVPLDLAIETGRVAEVAPEIASDKAHETCNASGKLIMPVVVDNEVHIPNPLQKCNVWALGASRVHRPAGSPAGVISANICSGVRHEPTSCSAA